jgi:TatD DNase family protein
MTSPRSERPAAGGAMIDSHAHLHLSDYDEDREAVLARAAEAGVTRVLEVGIDREGADRALALADASPLVKAAVGCHPHEAESWDEAFADAMRGWAGDGRVLAFGEIGLDHYRDYAPHDVQERAFRAQLALADACDMPVVFHVRAAESDFLRIVDVAGPPRRAVLHAFSHDEDFAAACLERGFWLGIGGILTFPKSTLSAVLADVPPERVLLETDCPWLAPVPRRGRRNEPALLVHVLARLAEIWGVEPEALERTLDANFARFAGSA